MSDASSLLREPWDRFERQRQAGKFGIWIFLASETLFFGALMLTYAVCRIEHPDAFAAAGRETNVWYGTMNTAILLTSSLTMAVASQAAAQSGRVKPLILSCLGATVALGLAFIVLKGFEYKEDIDKHLVPGAGFALSQPEQLFYGFYWLVTGVHAIHLTIGIALVARLVVLGVARRIQLRRNPELEVTALYWHLVDVVWIFLYPLIYLPGRA
jgi:cytochrome c oxidase subunit 3